MEFEHRVVSIAHIRGDDKTFRITTGKVQESFVASVKYVGLINPPILWPQGEEFVVISGFSRVAACRSLGWDQIHARVLSPETSFEICARIAIVDNSAQRELNLVEMARAFNLLSKAAMDDVAAAKTLHELGLQVNIELCRKLKAVTQMRRTVQQGLIDGTIALPIALRLNELSGAEEIDGICFLYNTLNMSLNRQREVLDWCQAISIREAMAIKDVLTKDPIAGWLNDSQLDRGRKTQLVREYLKRRRYPVITHFEEQYRSALCKLNMTRSIRLEPPANFEGRTFGLHLAFNNLQELIHLHSQIAKLIENPTFSEILDLVQMK
ncbi:MAG: hypothetical protein M0036_13315 [Desulfobacteraceae bacterium]|nr:hypothetical protein [Desulfobacteraceae bacterium]